MNIVQVVKKAHDEGMTIMCISRAYQRVVKEVIIYLDRDSGAIRTHCGKYYTISNKAKAKFSEDHSEVTLQGGGGNKVTLIFLRNDTEAYHSALGLTLLD